MTWTHSCTLRVTVRMDCSELVARYPSLRVQPLTSHLLSLHTRLRDQRTDTVSFVRAADALLRPLVEFALTTLPTRTIVSEPHTLSRSLEQLSSCCRVRCAAPHPPSQIAVH